MESQESESVKIEKSWKSESETLLKVKSFEKSGREEALTMLTSWKKVQQDELQNF